MSVLTVPGRLARVIALCVVLLGTVVSFPASADTYKYTVAGSPEYTITTQQNVCSLVAQAWWNILKDFRLSLGQYLLGTWCDGEFGGVGTSVSITQSWYKPGVGFDSGASTFVLSSITPASTPLPSTNDGPLAAYSVQEIVFFLGCCFSGFLGFSQGWRFA